jgi:hypothetical protein
MRALARRGLNRARRALGLSAGYKEPPLEACYHELRRFYANRKAEYAPILKELGEGTAEYDRWYAAGGYGYDPFSERKFLIEQTSLPQFRGTCLDIGSGDGFHCWLLSEWYSATGIEYYEHPVRIAEAIRKRLPLAIQRRTQFIVGDALDHNERYDVVFCRAPSFFNYPIHVKFDHAMLDHGRVRIARVITETDPEHAAERIAAYSEVSAGAHPYADRFDEFLVRMLSLTRKMFFFCMWTHRDYYGRYVGDTYCHDPDVLRNKLAEYGDSKVSVDPAGFIVAEIYL